MVDKTVNKIGEILKKDAKKDPINRGLSITELVKISKLKRCAVRTALAELKGARKVHIRKIGVSKIYYLK